MKNPKPGSRSYEQIRDSVLETLRSEAPDQLKTNELSRRIGIPATSPDYELLRQALSELEAQGEIFRGTRRRYGVKIPETTIEGRLIWLRPGQFCVVAAPGAACEVEVDSRNLRTALHGDTVRVKLLHSPRPGEIPEGEVTSVLQRGSDRIVGTVKKGRGFYIDPDDRKIHRTFNVHRSTLGIARAGDKVLARLVKWDDPFMEPEVSILEVLGRAGEMKAEIRSIALSHNLPFVFPDEAIAEADAFPNELQPEDLRGRRDLRDVEIVTIDPVDARDFDDAISIEQHDDGDVTIGVHIADVSHYVREGSAIDEEAYRRGTSVYLVTGVIPMLPERLSNNLCSLRPDEDRLAYSVLARLSPRGAIRNYEIVKSVIRSKRRFSYDEALEILEKGKGDFAHQLLAINRAAQIQRALRRRKGSVDFETTELKFRLDENDHPIEVIQKRATASTKLIEDCMLLANRIVAEHIGSTEKGRRRGGAVAPFVYRIHDAPPKDKLIELSGFVRQFGYSLPVENVQPKDIQRLIDAARGSDEEEMINEVTLRSMAKAVYSEFNIGHFGLAFRYYTHFTSPIRRYPDLIVHRMLNEYATGMSDQRRMFFSDVLDGITTHCSERERAAVEAERASTKVAQVQFLKQHLGDVFAGVIGGVMPFGLFVELKRYGIEGLVPVRTMTDDYYVYDERNRALRGRRTRTVYQLGSPVYVRVARVDEINSQIDLELIDESEYRADALPEEIGSAEPDVEKGGEEEGEVVRAARGSRPALAPEKGGRKRTQGETPNAPHRDGGRKKRESVTEPGRTDRATKRARAEPASAAKSTRSAPVGGKSSARGAAARDDERRRRRRADDERTKERRSARKKRR